MYSSTIKAIFLKDRIIEENTDPWLIKLTIWNLKQN
jgi:hypothetical protein